MKTFETNKKRSAPAARKARPYVHHPMGPVQQAQQAEIRRILRSTGTQAKLTIGQPNDKYEQEADRVADRVMTMPDSGLQRQPEKGEEEETIQTKPLAEQISPLVQRQEEPPEEEEEPVQAKLLQRQAENEEEEEEEETLQTKPLADKIPSLIQKQKESTEEEEESVQAKFKNSDESQVQMKASSAIINGALARGVSSASAPLPHLGKIQRSFGNHNVRGVQAFVGGPAAEACGTINAAAFTTGNKTAFARSPSLQTAAHEAAHVIQQRAGVSLKGGIGRDGDKYERHADAVADLVVKGKPSASLLDQEAGGRSAAQQGHTVQFYKPISGKAYDKLSDDGRMAVEDHTRNAWATRSLIGKANNILTGQKAKAEIKETGPEIKVRSPRYKSKKRRLKKYKMVAQGTATEVELTDDCGTANQQMLGSEAAGYESFVAANKRGTTQEFTKAESYHADDNAAGGIVSTTEVLSGEIYIRIFKREFKKNLNRVDALKEWDKLSKTNKGRKKMRKLARKYGINKFAVPKMGQGITIGSERDAPGATPGGYNFHFGLNLITSGHDYTTLEDYDSSGVRYYFDMYGPRWRKQAWSQASSNTSDLGNKTTTMVVVHPESLKGETNANNVLLTNNPDKSKRTWKKKLALGIKVTVIRKGNNWMKVKVTSGPEVNTVGWMKNKYYLDS